MLLVMTLMQMMIMTMMNDDDVSNGIVIGNDFDVDDKDNDEISNDIDVDDNDDAVHFLINIFLIMILYFAFHVYLFAFFHIVFWSVRPHVG